MITENLILNSKYPIVPITEVVTFLDSIRKPVKESEREEGIYPYYGANGIQGFIKNYLFDEPLILLAEDGGHFDDPSRGIAYRVSGKSWVNNHAHVLRPKENIDINYLFRVLENYDISHLVNGTTRGKLTQANASEIKIPLPPLPEQHRIAAILDSADAIRQKRKAAITKLDELSQSVFMEMFGDQNNPKYYFDRIDGYTLKITDGTHQSPNFRSEGVPFLFVSNIINNEITYDTRKYISNEDYIELNKRTPIEEGDLLFTTVGSYGNAAIVKGDTCFSFQRHIAYIKPNKKKLEPLYLYGALTSLDVKKQVDRAVKGVAQKTLNLSDLASIKIAIPNIEIQKSYASILLEIDSMKHTLYKSLQKEESLFSSLQHRAFAGEL